MEDEQEQGSEFTLTAEVTEYVEIEQPGDVQAAATEVASTASEPDLVPDAFTFPPVEIGAGEIACEPSIWDVPGVTVNLNGYSAAEWRAFVDSMGGPEGFFMATTGSIWNENGWWTGNAGTMTFHGPDGGFSFDAV